MTRLILPSELGDAFTVASAKALGVGVTRLRAPDLEQLFHGARRRRRAVASPRAETPEERAIRQRNEHLDRMRAYLPLMPAHAFFVGPSAAAVWGVPLPEGLYDEIHVGVLHPRTAPRRRGVAGMQVMPQMVRVVEKDGFRVASAATTWAMLGGTLGEYDLVAVADAFIRIPRHPGGFRPPSGPALATRAQLQSALDAGRRRGAALLHLALDRARTGSSSRVETQTRLTLVDGGLPEPQLDYDVCGPDGSFAGCSEMAYVVERVAVEYESDRHLTRRQLERDIDKYAAYAALGWDVVRLTSTHVYRQPGEAVRRVLKALQNRKP